MKNLLSIRFFKESLGRIFLITRATFSEIMEGRLVYGVLIAAFLLLAGGVLVSQLSFLHPEKIVLDFSYVLIQLTTVMMSLFFGSHVVKRDYENRKAFLVLSRPVSVLEFVTGKFFGVLALLVVIQIVLYPVVLGFYLLTGGDLSLTLFREVFLCFVLQGLLGAILISISIFFSSFSTSQLAFVCTFGLYFIGVNYSQIQFLASKGIATNALKLIELIVPNLEAFVRSHELAYSIPISSQLMMGLFGYAACFSSMALIPSSWIFSRREA